MRRFMPWCLCLAVGAVAGFAMGRRPAPEPPPPSPVDLSQPVTVVVPGPRGGAPSEVFVLDPYALRVGDLRHRLRAEPPFERRWTLALALEDGRTAYLGCEARPAPAPEGKD